jgi:hypothetical protein
MGAPNGRILIMAKTQPHVVPPASADEMTRSVKATQEDIRRVDQVLTELGLLAGPKSDKVMRRSVTTGKSVSKTGLLPLP